MSKFFVQMLLSVMVGVSAALGFSPAAKSELRDVLQDANAYLRERTNAVIENAHDLAGKMDAAISAKATSQASADGTEKADVKVNSTLNVKSSNGGSLLGSWLPDLSLNGFFSNKTQTDVKTDGSSLEVGLQEKIKSTLDLGVGQ